MCGLGLEPNSDTIIANSVFLLPSTKVLIVVSKISFETKFPSRRYTDFSPIERAIEYNSIFGHFFICLYHCCIRRCLTIAELIKSFYLPLPKKLEILNCIEIVRLTFVLIRINLLPNN